MHRLLLCLTAAVILAIATSVYAIANTPTGFVYPTGTAALGGYAGWLAHEDGYFPGLYHLGKDIDANEGDPVYAIDDGDVYAVNNSSAWGQGNVALLVRHKLSDGTVFLTIYGHIVSSLSDGDNVVAGEAIGVIGHYVNGDHLHFGIRPGTNTSAPLGRNGMGEYDDPKGFVDPVDWITTRNPGTTLFSDVVTRNGGTAAVGTPNANSHSGLIYAYGTYVRQDFVGGTFGHCCIMYDPRNGDGNP